MKELDVIGALEEIGRTVQLNPNDSIVDIMNDAFISFKLGLEAEWTDDDDDPIRVQYVSKPTTMAEHFGYQPESFAEYCAKFTGP